MLPAATERCKKEFFLLIEIKKNLSSSFFFLPKHKSLLYKKEKEFISFINRESFSFFILNRKKITLNLMFNRIYDNDKFDMNGSCQT
jgi:hypothetical protein